MKIVLTGKIGIGKTHICKKLVEQTKKVHAFSCSGIITHQEKQGKPSNLLIEDLSTGERRVFAYRKPVNTQEIVKGIPFCDFIFDRSTIEFAKEALHKPGDLLIIDEIGYLEMEGKGITNAISAFQSNQNKHSILVVRYELKDTISAMLNCSFELFEVNQKNRDTLPELFLKKMVKPIS